MSADAILIAVAIIAGTTIVGGMLGKVCRHLDYLDDELRRLGGTIGDAKTLRERAWSAREALDEVLRR